MFAKITHNIPDKTMIHKCQTIPIKGQFKANSIRWMTFLVVFFTAFFITHAMANTQTNLQYLKEMSIEELMDVIVYQSTLTGIERSHIPASVTVISQNDLQTTPARNLLDLIDIYVPGAMHTLHWLGPRLGMRGIATDQNQSFLVLVNGRNYSMKTNNSPLDEIQNRELDDIERIEIIRGAGSVIYGPGAIGGVINIITKSANQTPGLKLNIKGDPVYKYVTTSLNYAFKKEKLKGFLFGSFSRSEGWDDTRYYYIDRAHGYGYGFMNLDWGNKNKGTSAPNLFEDYWDKPQFKLHYDFQYNDNWQLWGRFTTYSYTLLQQEGRTADGPDFPGWFGGTFSTTLSNDFNFSDVSSIHCTASIGSQSIRRTTFWQNDAMPSDHITQRGSSYSENELSFQTMFHTTLQKADLAVGIAYSYIYLGPEWGMDDNTFIMDFPAPLKFVVLDSSSEFHQTYGGLTTVVEDLIDCQTVSLMGEIKRTFHPLLTPILSIRTDKCEYSDWAISPRVAIVSDLSRNNIVKSIWQHSVRFPAFTELYTEQYAGKSDVKPEILNSFELIWNYTCNEHLALQSSAYYNTIDQIAWVGEDLQNDVIGTFDLMGLELELSYQTNGLAGGLNYSFTSQLDYVDKMNLEAWVTNLSGDTYMLDDFGNNRINNLPRHAIKGFLNKNLSSNVMLHSDFRFFWNYQQKDMLDQFKTAHEAIGEPETIAEMNAIIDDLEEHGYTQPLFTSNFSLGYRLPCENREIEMQIYATNLISINNIRYVFQFWENDNLRQYPRQCSFVDEPLVIGCKLSIHF